MYDDYDMYEPTPEELREIEELINREEELVDAEEKSKNRFSNRVVYEFKSEDHWKGWLRIHGIRW